MIPEYFWAKTTQDEKPGKSVVSHMNDVRAVAEYLLALQGTFTKNTKCTTEQIASFAGLHDIGKISPGFQAKCRGWLQRYGLESNYGIANEKDHSIVTQSTIQNILQNKGMKIESAELWAAILGSHHGRLHRPGILPRINDGEWETKRKEIIDDFLGDTSFPNFNIDDSWPFLWWFAGLVSVSDWIGSAEEWFLDNHETTPEDSEKKASHAINTIGFNFPTIKKGLSFSDIFIDKKSNKPFIKNDLQLKSERSIQKPGLYIIEAPMGMGKTEAALWCAYQLIQKEMASGFYFALPTQATSNRIYIRINEFLNKITHDMLFARLVHANSWLLDDIIVPVLKPSTIFEKESARDAIDWFASKKRGLLAPFGVGTIDQALMSVIAVKHFFVRQFALAGKVVILDEVHSYDLYTGTLIKTLCERLLPLGCTIILLSATLTKEIKKRFIATETENGDEPYPLISGTGIKASEVLEPKLKKIKIRINSEKDIIDEALNKARHGASVLWVCNTVNKSQELFNFAKTKNQNNIEIGLLHARFPFYQRQILEEYWMEKLGKEGENRLGCLLFSTQIVEQSVDLDADFMVSELAPTDMLLQRMGRLWRHERIKRPLNKPEFWIVEEKYSLDEFKSAPANEIKKMLGTKAMVYAPYILLRSYQVWKHKDTIELPGDIRSLLEETYKPTNNESKSWHNLNDEIEGIRFALRQAAVFESNIWNPALDDEEGKAKTRLNALETTQLILALQKHGNTLHLLNDECIELKGENFVLQEARSVAKNIVKVPAYCFKDESKSITKSKKLNALVRGDWQVGFVENGIVHCTYLKETYSMRYTSEKGVEITKTDQ